MSVMPWSAKLFEDGTTHMWHGKPITRCTREELIDAVTAHRAYEREIEEIHRAETAMNELVISIYEEQLGIRQPDDAEEVEA